jgi:hypothetical protein
VEQGEKLSRFILITFNNLVPTATKTTHLHDKDHLVDAVLGNNRCLF